MYTINKRPLSSSLLSILSLFLATIFVTTEKIPAGALEAKDTKKDECRLDVMVTGIRTDAVVHLAIFRQITDGFPEKDHPVRELEENATKEHILKLTSITLPCGGPYYASLYLDENGNGKLDKNLIGIPKEGVGFSNNPDIKFGPPDGATTAFDIDATKIIEIHMYYY